MYYYGTNRRLRELINNRHKIEKVTKYLYYPEFDNDIPTLYAAYKLYDDCNICHIHKDGGIKCYQEINNVIKTETDFGKYKYLDNI